MCFTLKQKWKRQEQNQKLLRVVVTLHCDPQCCTMTWQHTLLESSQLPAKSFCNTMTTPPCAELWTRDDDVFDCWDGVEFTLGGLAVGRLLARALQAHGLAVARGGDSTSKGRASFSTAQCASGKAEQHKWQALLSFPSLIFGRSRKTWAMLNPPLGVHGVPKKKKVFVATFRVAKLTLQTRKLWLVGVATGPSSTLPLTCPNVKNLEKVKRNARKKKTRKRKMKRNASKKKGRKNIFI